MPARRPTPGISSSRRDLAIATIGFILAILLLDTAGLAQWAHRLDIGPLQRIAMPLTQRLDAALGPYGGDALRATLLADLGRAGWSDDPAASLRSVPQADITPPVPPGDAYLAALALQSPRAAAIPAGPAPGPAPVPATPSAAPPNRLPRLVPIPPGRPRLIALAGDSMMAVSLSDNLLRATQGNPGLRLIKAYRSGTGLARPDVFDWMSEYSAMLGANRPDLVLVTIGANDAQSYLDPNGNVLTFGTPAWIASYRARVAAYLAMLGAHGAQIIWIGLPPMRATHFQTNIELINQIDQSVVATTPDATWFNPATLIGTPTGQYRQFGPVNHHIENLREPDGTHLTNQGASLVTDILGPWLAGK
jgi:lysophospholipase L1-like esterase